MWAEDAGLDSKKAKEMHDRLDMNGDELIDHNDLRCALCPSIVFISPKSVLSLFIRIPV